jgi:hypothetical protein
MHPGTMPQAGRRKAAYGRRFAGEQRQALLLHPVPVWIIESSGDQWLAYLLRIIRRQRGFCRHPLERVHLVERSHGCSPMLRNVTRCHSVVHAVPSSLRILYHLIYKDQDRAASSEPHCQFAAAVRASAARQQIIARRPVGVYAALPHRQLGPSGSGGSPRTGPLPPLPRSSPPAAPPAGRVLSPCWLHHFPHQYDQFSPAFVHNLLRRHPASIP